MNQKKIIAALMGMILIATTVTGCGKSDSKKSVSNDNVIVVTSISESSVSNGNMSWEDESVRQECENGTDITELVENDSEDAVTVSETVTADESQKNTDSIGTSFIDETVILNACLTYTGATYADPEYTENDDLMVHCYDLTTEDDGTCHTATYDWITVNQVTGEAETMLGEKFNILDYQ